MALSTGFPELFVVIQSLIVGKPMLAMGDIIGSNFIDISLALGISSSCIGAIKIDPADNKKQTLMLIISAAIMAFVFMNGLITRRMGITLIAIYIIGTFWLYKIRHMDQKTNHKKLLTHAYTISKNGALARLIGHLMLVLIASKICVTSALTIADIFNFPIAIIGATIFAVGTSLPEIALNIQAVRNENYSLAIGNSLGSVFSQAGLMLGILATFAQNPLPTQHLLPVVPVMFAAYALIGFHLFTHKKIGRSSGLFLIALYIGYVIREIVIHW